MLFQKKIIIILNLFELIITLKQIIKLFLYYFYFLQLRVSLMTFLILLSNPTLILLSNPTHISRDYNFFFCQHKVSPLNGYKWKLKIQFWYMTNFLGKFNCSQIEFTRHKNSVSPNLHLTRLDRWPWHWNVFCYTKPASSGGAAVAIFY